MTFHMADLRSAEILLSPLVVEGFDRSRHNIERALLHNKSDLILINIVGWDTNVFRRTLWVAIVGDTAITLVLLRNEVSLCHKVIVKNNNAEFANALSKISQWAGTVPAS